jgi:hypothetical protein
MGAIAGMVAFAIYGTLITVYAPGGSSNVLAQDTSGPGGFVLQAMAVVVTVTIPLGAAALMGWLGGRPGAMRARKARHRADNPADAASPDTSDVRVDAATSEG